MVEKMEMVEIEPRRTRRPSTVGTRQERLKIMTTTRTYWHELTEQFINGMAWKIQPLYVDQVYIALGEIIPVWDESRQGYGTAEDDYSVIKRAREALKQVKGKHPYDTRLGFVAMQAMAAGE